MQNSDPIFKSVFAEDWHDLPPIMHKHYANRPFCDDKITATGLMTIEFGWLITIASPILKLLGLLVPYKGVDIPTTVEFLSSPKSSNFALNRSFNFPNKKPIKFVSKLVQLQDNLMVEEMNYGICWRHKFSYKNQKVILQHVGFSQKIFGKYIPIPIEFLIGKGYAEEVSISDNAFKMQMKLKHPIWGTLYTYKGQFEIKQGANNA